MFKEILSDLGIDEKDVVLYRLLGKTALIKTRDGKTFYQEVNDEKVTVSGKGYTKKTKPTG